MLKWAHITWVLGLLWVLVGPAAGELTFSTDAAAGKDNIAPAPCKYLYLLQHEIVAIDA